MYRISYLSRGNEDIKFAVRVPVVPCRSVSFRSVPVWDASAPKLLNIFR